MTPADDGEVSFADVSDELQLDRPPPPEASAGDRTPAQVIPIAQARGERGALPATPHPGEGAPRRRRRWVPVAAFVAVVAAAAGLVAGRRHLASAPRAAQVGTTARAGLSPPSTAAEARPPAPSARRAATTATDLVIGVTLPLGGAARDFARGLRTGLELAVAAANAAGGIGGRELRLAAVPAADDTGGDDAIRQLVEKDRALAVVAGAPSATGLALATAVEREVVLLGAAASPAAQPGPQRRRFALWPGDAEEAAAALRYLVEVRRRAPSQIALFTQDGALGAAVWGGIAAELRRLGADPERLLRLSCPPGSASVDAAVEKLRAAGEVSGVVLAADHRAASRFVQRARDAGVEATFAAVSAVDADALADDLVQAGAPYTRDVVVTQVVPPPDSRATAVVRYRDALARHAAAERPGYASLRGWVAGSVLVEALRRAGAEPDADSLARALEGLRDLDLGFGSPVSFGLSSEHDRARKLWGTALQPDGAWTTIDLE